MGGWIVDAVNWRWVFYINLPVGILATIFIAMGLKSHKQTGPIKIDIAGIFTMILGVVSLLLALTFAEKITHGILANYRVICISFNWYR